MILVALIGFGISVMGQVTYSIEETYATINSNGSENGKINSTTAASTVYIVCKIRLRASLSSTDGKFQSFNVKCTPKTSLGLPIYSDYKDVDESKFYNGTTSVTFIFSCSGSDWNKSQRCGIYDFDITIKEN